MNWNERAACRDAKDPELFHPVGNNGPAKVQAQQAKAVCQRCPVTVECLEAAELERDDWSIRGGMTADERRRLLRRRFARTGGR